MTLSTTSHPSRSTALRSTLVRRSAAVAAAGLLAVGLSACSSDKESPAEANARASEQAEAAVSELNEQAATETVRMPEETSVNDPGAPQISADKTQDLTDGDEITVTVRGLDISAGYYVAVCKEGTGADAAGEGGAPDCTGDQSSAAWLTAGDSDEGTAHFDADGNAEVPLTVSEKGDAVDCATDTCVIKVFGDHSNGFRSVGEAPVSFAS